MDEQPEQSSVKRAEEEIVSTAQTAYRVGKFLKNSFDFVKKYGRLAINAVKLGLAAASGGATLALELAKKAGSWVLKKAADGIKGLFDFGWNISNRQIALQLDRRPWYEKHKLVLVIIALVLSPFLLIMLPAMLMSSGGALVTSGPHRGPVKAEITTTPAVAGAETTPPSQSTQP